MPYQNKITLDQVREVVTQVVAENPDAINPLHSDGCAYTKQADDQTPNAAEHCIGGTVLLRLGLGLPDEGTTVLSTPDRNRLEGDALSYIRFVQFAADGFPSSLTNTRRPGPIRTWSEAKVLADEKWADKQSWEFI